MAGFEDLKIYKKSIQGVKLIFNLNQTSPLKNNFSLVDQISRASTSVSANIAEGYGRKTKKDRVKFLTYSIGSLNEVIAYLYPKISTKEEKEYYKYLGKQIYLFRKNIID